MNYDLPWLRSQKPPYEYCFEFLVPGLPTYQVFNHLTNCSTPYEQVTANPVTLFFESCTEERPDRDVGRKCFVQNQIEPKKVIIAGMTYLVCGPEDKIESENGTTNCQQDIVLFDDVIAINNICVARSVEPSVASV